MLHIKFHLNRSNGSGELFLKGFTIYGHGGHPGHVTSIMFTLVRHLNKLCEF